MGVERSLQSASKPESTLVVEQALLPRRVDNAFGATRDVPGAKLGPVPSLVSESTPRTATTVKRAKTVDKLRNHGTWSLMITMQHGVEQQQPIKANY